MTVTAGTTLTREDVDTVKLGTTIGNVGLEGLTNDPTSGDFSDVFALSNLEDRFHFETR